MNDRQERIYKIIEKMGNARIEHLEKEVYASPATVRRDLKKMEQMGLIKRVWGGATLVGKANLDPPSFMREVENTQSKKKIARKALQFIEDGNSVFLPSGSTVTELSKILDCYKDLTIITSCINVINVLRSYSSFKVISPGGELYENYDFVGTLTKEFLDKFSVDVLFFSCSGITAEGFTSNDVNRLNVIQTMHLNSNKTVLLCDATKVGVKCTFKGFGFDKIDYVIMDKMPNDIKLIKTLGKKLIIAQ